MDLMDVDRPEDLSSSLPSSLNSQHIKDILSPGQLTTLNDRMTLASQIWQNSIVAAEGDDSQLQFLIKIVFALLTSALKDTAIKDNVVTAQLAEELVESFNEDELKHSKVVVHNCVEKKDWVDLIPALTIPTRPNAASTPLYLSRLLDREAHTVLNAWNTEYKDDHHRLLLNNINCMSRDKPYSTSVIILESSGTGKSRMVHELSDLVFTLPFNLRPDSENKDFAYPPDTEIRDYLDTPRPTLDEYQARYLLLLGHIFRAVSAELGRIYAHKQPTYAALAHEWRMHLDDAENRSRIYKEAEKGCANDMLKDSSHMYLHPEVNLDAPVSAVSKMAKNELALLLKRIDDCCESMTGLQSNHVKLMLYFDEAHVLAGRIIPKDLEGKNTYDVLCLCFNFFLSSPIFVIYLSTTSSISQLAPSGSLARSARARDNTDALQAPVTEIPFDCSPIFPIIPGKLGLDDVCKVEFMAQFGRPMFWTLLAAAGERFSLQSWISDLDRNTALAVVDVLLTLDFEPRRQVTCIREAQLVASHMRIAFSVPKEREYIRSGYPSEPLLAEAAARQMDEFQTLTPDINVMLDTLKHELDSGLLDQGQRGKVVFRLLLSQAYRCGIQKDHADDSRYNFSKGCKLTTFIQELFSKDYAKQILDSVPDNIKISTTFQTAFKDAIVCFTHFGKMGDDTGTTTHAMFAAFVRCMAITGWSSQETVDILIPVLLDRKKKLSESAMTGLLIQVTRCRRQGPVTKYEINQKEFQFFPSPPDSTTDTRPYATLVAELGVQLPISQAAITPAKGKEKVIKSAPNPSGKRAIVGTSTASTTEPESLYIPVQPGSINHLRDVHPRYSIFAYGCSDKVYSVITGSDRPVFKFLLENRDMLDEHPRTDSASLLAARAMKPFWSAGVGCYKWIQNDFLQKYEKWDNDNGGLAVGKYEDDTIGETY
ncbi:hypothetical protein PILCRDRAFT_6971 [Piloderma croceum F 1598]|uniref:Uncharacterized protein n=1 Tax=Piloderma croceum (strain F 1598) TaxID=765440 RepID=A0A0C3BB75_PILCF|nr:hypothetical protein PILCRDRAFT_6971 [Piloderma croceum F 1598]